MVRSATGGSPPPCENSWAPVRTEHRYRSCTQPLRSVPQKAQHASQLNCGLGLTTRWVRLANTLFRRRCLRRSQPSRACRTVIPSPDLYSAIRNPHFLKPLNAQPLCPFSIWTFGLLDVSFSRPWACDAVGSFGHRAFSRPAHSCHLHQILFTSDSSLLPPAHNGSALSTYLHNLTRDLSRYGPGAIRRDRSIRRLAVTSLREISDRGEFE